MTNPSGDSTITGLPAAAALQGTEFLVMDQVQGGIPFTVKATVNQIISQGLGTLLAGTPGQMLVLQAGTPNFAAFSNAATIVGGSINNTSIGATTKNTGAFTTLSANNGLTVTAGASSFVGGVTIDSLTLTNALAVTGGGTGRATLTNHSVLVGAATTAVTQVVPSTAGQALISAGAAADPVFGIPTGALIKVDVFTASGTWTRPAGCNSAIAHIIGGGGGGGGAPATGAGQASLGGGGGSGGYTIAIANAPGATETVTIGGAGGGGAGVAGGTGGTSSFGAWGSALGGPPGGVNGPAAGITTLAGAAGAAVSGTGTAQFPGNPAQWGLVNQSGVNGNSGAGGNGVYGGAGTGIAISANGNNAAANTGGGGSGALNRDPSVGAKTGGNGGTGIIIVYSFG